MSQRVLYLLERRRGLLYLRAAVGDGVSTPVIARLLVDTGSSFTVISNRVLQSARCEMPQTPRIISITAAGGVIRVPRLQVPLFSALGRSQSSYEVVALDLPSSAGVDGLLGIDFLTLCGAMIDVKRSQVVIEAAEV
jgi:predicted aspartyl protease